VVGGTDIRSGDLTTITFFLTHTWVWHMSLYDCLMYYIHSESGRMHPGDNGAAGIRGFVAVHQCNDLCRALSLQPFPDEL
jgi:hypothetical protein